MKLFSLDKDGFTQLVDVEVNVQGCFYPKGFVIQFSDENVLIDFITKLPDNVWDYWGDSVTAVYFTQDYYFINKPIADDSQEDENV